MCQYIAQVPEIKYANRIIRSRVVRTSFRVFFCIFTLQSGYKAPKASEGGQDTLLSVHLICIMNGLNIVPKLKLSFSLSPGHSLGGLTRPQRYDVDDDNVMKISIVD